MTRTRRFLWFVALVGPILVIAVRKWKASSAPPSAPPSWPRLEAETPVPTPSQSPEPITEPPTVTEPVTDPTAATVPAWVEPVDGTCPATHPIKANPSSRIYHSPGGRFYERTRAERCYADAGAAEADGYRAAKGSVAGREEQEEDST